jgi:hypothetical protein
VLTPSTRLNDGRYVLTRFLRAGGAGVVWAARDTRPRMGDSPDVAIKVLDAAAGGSDAASREAEVAARVRHPNVVRVRDTFVQDGLACMVMDRARGSLADLVARVGPLPPPVALGCALQACEALAEAHRAGVVHRDVKPHNLLVFDDGSVRLADFGAARALVDGHTRTRTGALLGSIPFMAPEQRRDPRAVRPSTDVYALAVTLAWLLLGESPDDPWTEEAAAQLRAAGVPEGLVRAVAIGGARRAEERPNDGAAFAEVLRGCGVVASAGGLAEREVWGDSGGAGADRSEGAGSGVDFWGGGPRPPATPPGQARRSGAVIWGALAAGAIFASGLYALRPSIEPASVDLARDDTEELCPDAFTRWVVDKRMGPRETTNAAVADVDGDALPDVIFTNMGAESVTVWSGSDTERGDPLQLPMGRSFSSVAVGDVDHDGYKDIVAARPDSGDIAVVLRDAAAGWKPAVSLPQTPVAEFVTVVDWNGDGVDDVLFRQRDGVSIRVDSKPGDTENRAGAARHRDIARYGPGTLFAALSSNGEPGVVLDSPEGDVLRLTPATGGTGLQRLTRGPDPTVARYMISDIDQNGSEELYAATHSGTVRRLWRAGASHPPCLLATGLPYVPAALVPGVGNRPWSAVAFDSCTGCDSNHIFLTGSP